MSAPTWLPSRSPDAWRPYTAPDLRAERTAALVADNADLRAEVARLRRRLGDDVRRQAGLDERRRERWVQP